MDWIEEGDSILRSKIAVEFDVTLTGGIYEDTDLKKVGIGMIEKNNNRRNNMAEKKSI